MAYVGKNPKFDSTILDDQAASAVTSPASGSHKVINRNGFLFLVDSAGSETPIGSGAGEINLVDNPSTVNGWVASAAGVTVATSTTSTDLPLDGVYATCLKITPVSGTDYARYRFTMPASLKQTKQKVEWFQRPLSGYAAGDFKLEVYKNAASNYGGAYTEFALSTDASGTTSIPASTGKFTTYFDADDADYYEVRIVRTAGTTALNLANIVIGPGIQPQGAVVGALTVGASLTLNNMPAVALSNFSHQRIGECLHLIGEIQFSADGVSGSLVSITLPNSLTASTTTFAAGCCEYFVTGDGRPAPLEAQGVAATSNITLTSVGFTSTIVGTECGTSSGRITNIYIDAMIPINEWAGSGTVNVAQNDIEYASNSSTTDAADTTSFVYGPAGSTIVSTLTAARAKRVRFPTPYSAGDIITLETQSQASAPWVTFIGDEDNGVSVYGTQNSVSYGVALRYAAGSPTDFDVYFGQYAQANGATFGAAGRNWSGPNGAGMKWRLKKVRGGQSVGFSTASKTSKGLVSSYAPTVLSRYKELNNAAYTILDNDGYDYIYSTTTFTAERTVTLPTAADNAGRVITIKKADSGAFNLVVDGEGTETIDGATTVTLTTQYNYVTVICTGTAWHIVAQS